MKLLRPPWLMVALMTSASLTFNGSPAVASGAKDVAIPPDSGSIVEGIDGFAGDVYNGTVLTMRIARWESGQSTCKIWNSGAGTTPSERTVSCKTQSLQVNSWDPWYYDTDLFTVPGASYDLAINGIDVGRKPAGVYTRIEDNQVAECYSDSFGIYCIVTT